MKTAIGILSTLKNKSTVYRIIAPTLTDGLQFERNCRKAFIVDILDGNIEMIEKHQSYIGREVYKFDKSFPFIECEEWEKKEHHKDMINTSLNPINHIPVKFTEALFSDFVSEYLRYQISYYTKWLVENSITQNSTNKLSNLEFEWYLECRQELIRLYKELLGIY